MNADNTEGSCVLIVEKIFADSSFYDEPEHKYPTIEEQIKMARKVAQSLMAPGNVKARGQRMFLRRREKADHWTADALGPRGPPGLRRAAAARAAAAAVAEQHESDAELPYYNPAPWASAAAATAWSPWSQAGGGSGGPSWTPKPPPPADTSPTSAGMWRPVHHVEPARPMPTHSGNVGRNLTIGSIIMPAPHGSYAAIRSCVCLFFCLSVCLSDCLIFWLCPVTRWLCACIAVSNVFAGGQHGRLCPRSNAISMGISLRRAIPC